VLSISLRLLGWNLPSRSPTINHHLPGRILCRCAGARKRRWPCCRQVRRHARQRFRRRLRRRDSWACPCFFVHAAGSSPAEQVVIESYADSFHRRRASPGKPLIQTNHFVSSFGHDLNPDDGIDENGYCWDTYPRYKAISKRLAGRRPKSLAEGLKVMACSTVTHSSTMNQMALCPAEGRGGHDRFGPPVPTTDDVGLACQRAIRASGSPASRPRIHIRRACSPPSATMPASPSTVQFVFRATSLPISVAGRDTPSTMNSLPPSI
jgi:hypothetical protein